MEINIDYRIACLLCYFMLFSSLAGLSTFTTNCFLRCLAGTLHVPWACKAHLLPRCVSLNGAGSTHSASEITIIGSTDESLRSKADSLVNMGREWKDIRGETLAFGRRELVSCPAKITQIPEEILHEGW